MEGQRMNLVSRRPRLTFSKKERAQVEVEPFLFGGEEESARALLVPLVMRIVASLEIVEGDNTAIFLVELSNLRSDHLNV